MGLVDARGGIVTWLYESFMSFFRDYLKKGVFGLAEMLMDLVVSTSADFWNDPVIGVLLDFSQWINYFVFILSLLFLLFDIALEQGGRGVDWSHVITGFIKAFAFVLFNRWIALLTVELADTLVRVMDFKEFDLSPTTITGNMMEFFSSVNPGFNLMLVAIVILATGIFLFVVIQRFSAMFIHILTSAFYITDIVRGDNEKLGEWLRQMVAISGTYVFQYLLYYLGLYLCSKGSSIAGIGCWICIASVGKVLQRYGYSTGTKGAIGNASRLAGQGLTRLIKL